MSSSQRTAENFSLINCLGKISDNHLYYYQQLSVLSVESVFYSFLIYDILFVQLHNISSYTFASQVIRM